MTPQPEAAEAVQKQITEQVQAMGTMPSVISKDELAQAESMEDVLNRLLKGNGVNRKARRMFIAKKRKPAKKARR